MSTAKAKPAEIVYIVEGSRRAEFPLDMLRRDGAKALTGDDKMKIDLLAEFGSERNNLPKRVRISLTRPNDNFGPYADRWESFGWKVVECSEPTRLITSKGLERTSFDVDALRQKTIRKIGAEVVRLNGYAHMAEVTYNAIRYAGDVAAMDGPYREQAIGMVTGVYHVLGTNRTAGLLDRSDNNAFQEALDVVRQALMFDDEKCRKFCIGDEPTLAVGALQAIQTKFGVRK